jgi:hypothetical protein
MAADNATLQARDRNPSAIGNRRLTSYHAVVSNIAQAGNGITTSAGALARWPRSLRLPLSCARP